MTMPIGRILAGLFPVAFAATYVLLSFSATPNPVSALVRPLAVAVVVVVVLQAVIFALVRRWDRAGLITAAIVMVLLANWVPLLVLAGGVAWLAASTWLQRRKGATAAWTESRLARVTAVFAWALLVVAAVPVVVNQLTQPSFAAPRPDSGDPPAAESDVVILLLDGYPRADALEAQFGVDSAPFEAELAARGFNVARSSRSNYTSTWMTIASMVHGRYVHDIEGLGSPPAGPAEQYRRLMAAIRDAPILDELRAQGYEIVTVPSPYESAALTSADRMLTPPEMSSFELSLLQHSLAGRLLFEGVPDLAFDQHRSRVYSSLDLVVDEVADASDTPSFVLAHLLAPHAPIAFGSAEEDPAPACFPDCSLYLLGPSADWSRYPSHLEAVNRAVIHAVDRIREASPDAMIILMSDHGTVSASEHARHAVSSFFAASVPPESVSFPSDVSPVDVIRLIVDPAAAPTSPYAAWESAAQEPMTTTPLAGTRGP
jgi:hypothetical protein